MSAGPMTSQEAPYVSPYLLTPAKPRPRWFPGDRIGDCTVTRIEWTEHGWHYVARVRDEVAA